MSAGSDVTDLGDLKSIPVSSLSSSLSNALAHKQEAVDRHYYDNASSFLSLHSEVQSSLDLLSSLSSFLSTFQSDLSNVSGHISDLQQRSHALDARLKGRRELDRLLSKLIADVTLSPRLVDLFFDSEPKQGGWVEACEDLERVLDRSQGVASLMPAVSQLVGIDPATPTSATPLSAQQTTGGFASNGPAASRGSALAAAASAADAAIKANPGQPPETRILLESRFLAASCLAIAVRKLRPYLISFFHPFKTSISTNLQVLQTSVLLKPTHRNLYAFLARQAPRVAIDVQRAYLGAARLYFETGFRRYTRALEKIRVRSAGWVGGSATGSKSSNAGVDPKKAPPSGSGTSSAFSEPLIGDVSPTGMGSAALALLSRAGGLRGGSDVNELEKADHLFVLDEYRLAQSKFEGAGVILGYMADNPSFRAPPEALFRSLALTFLDNACSEYTFLVRYFESLPSSRHKQTSSPSTSAPRRTPRTSVAGSGRQSIDGRASAGLASPRIALAARQLSNSTFQSMSVPGTPPLSERAGWSGASTPGGYAGPDPDESASMAGDDREEIEASNGGRTRDIETAEEDQDTVAGNIVTLTPREQKSRKGKGVEAELWRQVMEPVLGHWTSFTKALLSTIPAPSLLSLLSMVKLNEALMAAASVRGATNVLQAPLLTFKIEAWPLIQRAFDEHILSLRKLMSSYGISTAGRPSIAGSASSSSGAGAAVAAVAGLTSWAGLTGLVNAAANATGNFSSDEKLATLRLVCTRYARLFVSVVLLSEEQNETMLFGSMGRLREEIEWLAKGGAKVVASEKSKGKADPSMEKIYLADYADAVCKALADNGGRISSSHPRMQSELSHWSELRNSAAQ